MIYSIVYYYFICDSNQYYRVVARKVQFWQFGQPSGTVRNNVENQRLAGARRTGKYFAPAGKKCSGCLTYPCKSRQVGFARTGYNAWRQPPYLRGPVGGGRP